MLHIDENEEQQHTDDNEQRVDYEQNVLHFRKLPRGFRKRMSTAQRILLRINGYILHMRAAESEQDHDRVLALKNKITIALEDARVRGVELELQETGRYKMVGHAEDLPNPSAIILQKIEAYFESSTAILAQQKLAIEATPTGTKAEILEQMELIQQYSTELETISRVKAGVLSTLGFDGETRDSELLNRLLNDN
jgi:hypothetical protein